MSRFTELMEVEGYDDEMQFLEDCVSDVFMSGTPAICTECGYATYMEPDQDRGWCEECESNTVKSALVLAGII